MLDPWLRPSAHGSKHERMLFPHLNREIRAPGILCHALCEAQVRMTGFNVLICNLATEIHTLPCSVVEQGKTVF